MKGIWIVICLLGCTSTRQLASPSDVRLRATGHSAGFVVKTEEKKGRIDPNTTLRFHSENGWTDWVRARSLHVDADGVWMRREYRKTNLKNRIRVEELSDAHAGILLQLKPTEGELEHLEGKTYRLNGYGDAIAKWVDDYELAVAQLDPDDSPEKVCTPPPCEYRYGEWAKLERLRKKGMQLGKWSLLTSKGWSRPTAAHTLANLLYGGAKTKAGWSWQAIDKIEVRNVSGGKTYGRLLLLGTLGVLLAPLGILARGLDVAGGERSSTSGSGSGSSVGGFSGSDSDSESDSRIRPLSKLRAGQPVDHIIRDGDWHPEVARPENEKARRLFTFGSRVRAIALPTIALDGAAATRGDYLTAGVIGRMRFWNIAEIGGGVRMTESLRNDGLRTTSRTGVFQLGLHLPFDAGHRFAGLLGIEAGSGKVVASDVRFTWGMRFTAGRWFLTAHPGSPAYMRRDDRPSRWSLSSGLEIGTGL